MEPSMQQMQSNTLSVPNFLQYPIVNYLPLFSRSKHSFHCANIGPHSAFCPFGSLRYIQRLTQFSLAQERWTQALYALSSRVDRPVLDTRCSRLESACFALWWLLMRHVDRCSLAVGPDKLRLLVELQQICAVCVENCFVGLDVTLFFQISTEGVKVRLQRHRETMKSLRCYRGLG